MKRPGEKLGFLSSDVLRFGYLLKREAIARDKVSFNVDVSRLKYMNPHRTCIIAPFTW